MDSSKLSQQCQKTTLRAWIRIVVCVLVAIIVSVMLAVEFQNASLVKSCIRGGDSKVIDAEFFDSAATKNFEIGFASKKGSIARTSNLKAARSYVELSLRKRKTIPMPDGWNGRDDDRGSSISDRKRGCEDAFQSPIAWIG
jgi:hypothetical protein